ncbi:putative 3-hydroxyisobutyryl-CoA hydrolase [Helianthus anomalus]
MLSFTRKRCYVPRFFDILRTRSFSNNTLSDSSVSVTQLQLHTHNTCKQTNVHMILQVLVEGNGSSRTVILNRPSVLNALNTPMLNKLHKLYKSWEDNPDIAFVVMKGSGRAFCSGGDIVSFYDMIRKGNIEECKEFFSTLYEFIYSLSTYIKPQVAVLDGVTMGGGAGVAIPETFRVATDKTVCCPLVKKFTGGVLYVSKSCKFCCLSQTRLDFLLKSDHVHCT